MYLSMLSLFSDDFIILKNTTIALQTYKTAPAIELLTLVTCALFLQHIQHRRDVVGVGRGTPHHHPSPFNLQQCQSGSGCP